MTNTENNQEVKMGDPVEAKILKILSQPVQIKKTHYTYWQMEVQINDPYCGQKTEIVFGTKEFLDQISVGDILEIRE